jgi:tRNA dimethylallyltransferase
LTTCPPPTPPCAPAGSPGADQGWPALHAELARVDPATAARLAPADSQRIQRALEVWHVTGQPMSSFHTTKKRATSADSISATALFSLEPEDRAWLHERIAQRFDAMLAEGFVDEVRPACARRPAPRPAVDALRGLPPGLGSAGCPGGAGPEAPLDLAGLRERGIAATRQLAKRQITWLRSMPHRHTIACDQPDATARLVQAVLHRLERTEHAAP